MPIPRIFFMHSSRTSTQLLMKVYLTFTLDSVIYRDLFSVTLIFNFKDFSAQRLDNHHERTAC